MSTAAQLPSGSSNAAILAQNTAELDALYAEVFILQAHEKEYLIARIARIAKRETANRQAQEKELLIADVAKRETANRQAHDKELLIAEIAKLVEIAKLAVKRQLKERDGK